MSGANTRAMNRLERDVEQLVEAERRGGTTALVTLSERIKAKVVEATARAIPETERDAALGTLRAQFMDAARAQLAIAKEQGPEAVEDLRADLHGELETLFADAEEPEVAASSFEPTSQISSVKSQNQSNCLDTGVQAAPSESGFPDFPEWLAANRERVDAWCSTDTEQWQMYEAEKQLAAEERTVEDIVSSVPPDELPTAFKLARANKGGITYAEDYLV